LAACNNEENNGENDDDYSSSVTSRLIRHTPGTLDTYQLELGPFPPDELLLENDETTASTLVVNDVDRWIPSLSDWMDERFSFLPRWRRDDAQVSLAKKGGGIGPHVDNYDVFLIQTSGSRTWEVGLSKLDVKEEFEHLVDASQVRILNVSIPTTLVQVNAGDCLYLPPRVVHCGTSTSDDCITLSVGCRSPSASELLSQVAELVSTSTFPAAVERYTDFDLLVSSLETAKSLTPQIKEDMKRLVLQAINLVLEDDSVWEKLVGKLITQPNRPPNDEYPLPLHGMDEEWKNELGIWADPDAALEQVLGGTGALYRAEGVSVASSSSTARIHGGPTARIHGGDEMLHRLFVQGRVFEVTTISSDQIASADVETLLCQIANGPPLDGKTLGEMGVTSLSSEVNEFLKNLIAEGILYGSSEDDEGHDDEP
jgi:50S ribosomal protein L16 3-hydroxylase